MFGTTSTRQREAASVDEPEHLLQLIKVHRQSQPATAPIWLAKRKLAAELRRINNTLCDCTANAEDVLALALMISEKAALLGLFEREEQPGAPTPSVVPGMDTFHDRGPIAGRSNPISPRRWRST
jgi:hypothetical protein